MTVNSKRFFIPGVPLQVMQRSFREPELLPIDIGDAQNLLPDLIRILAVNLIARAHQVELTLLLNQIMSSS